MNQFVRLIFALFFLGLMISCTKSKSSYNQPYDSSSSVKKENKKDPKYVAGEEIFDRQCAACHRMDKKLVGPSLKNITKERDKKWILQFITDNQKLLDKKDPDALKIWEEYHKSPMPSFNHLKKKELENLYFYLDEYSKN